MTTGDSPLQGHFWLKLYTTKSKRTFEKMFLQKLSKGSHWWRRLDRRWEGIPRRCSCHGEGAIAMRRTSASSCTSCHVSAERSCLRTSMSDTRWTLSARYGCTVPMTQWYDNIHSLNSILLGTRKQWRSISNGLKCSDWYGHFGRLRRRGEQQRWWLIVVCWADSTAGLQEQRYSSPASYKLMSHASANDGRCVADAR